jgi:hypothetical protein
MLKQFITLNAKLWWRSLQGLEIAAILFYSFFILLVVGQFLGVILILLFTTRAEQAQAIYPWVTPEIQKLSHLIFVNSLWFSQILFTKINRLRLHDNRKLLALGFPVNKLSNYLNAAGFFHPVNLLFQFFWLTYLGFLAKSPLQLTAVILLVLVNYGLINSLKWRFRIYFADKFKHAGGLAVTFIILIIILALNVDLTSYISSPQKTADSFIAWFYYTPGYIFYYTAAELNFRFEQIFVPFILLSLLFMLKKDMFLNTKSALLTPVQTSSKHAKKSRLPDFIKWFGHEGGKYFYSVWNHKYSKIQMLITYVFVFPYIILLGDGTYIIGVFLTLIPVIFLMVLLTNLFGFENRELLLSVQLPIDTEEIVRRRIYTALLVTLGGSGIVLIAVPVFITSIPVMIQTHLGIFLIALIFLHYILRSSIKNYSKIEEVSIMSVSNPVLPASITFSSVFIVMFSGLFTFLVIENYIWYHILALFILNILLVISFRKKMNNIAGPFKQKVIPKLWNEL